MRLLRIGDPPAVRTYGQVGRAYWTGPTGRKLRALGRDVQLLGVYLLTCPNSTMIGLYYLPITTISHELGRTLEGASKDLRRATQAQFAYYDLDSEHVWIPNMARYQIGDSLRPLDRRVTGVINLLLSVQHVPFFKDFIDLYATQYSLQKSPRWGEIDKVLQRPFEGPYKPLRSQEQEQEQEQEQKRALSAKKRAEQTDLESGFALFWERYPRRVKKRDALKAWVQVKPEAATQDRILADVLRRSSGDPEWTRERGRFIPHPSTYLRGRRWEDEEQTARTGFDVVYDTLREAGQ